MKSFWDMLLEQEAVLSELLESVDENEELNTKRLRIASRGNNPQYYVCEKGQSTKGKYIRKNEIDFARQIANSEYHKVFGKKLHSQLNAVRQCIKAGDLNKLAMIYDQMSSERKKLVIPLLLSDEEYVSQWQNQEYERKPFEPGTAEIYSARGERVRSKSEKIIADQLGSYGIPYKYECPLILDNKLIHPDFTVLNVRLRKQIYLEHCGMMDEKEYSQNAVKRIEMYEKNGIMPGIGIVFTFETRTVPLNTRVLDRIIHEYFL